MAVFAFGEGYFFRKTAWAKEPILQEFLEAHIRYKEMAMPGKDSEMAGQSSINRWMGVIFVLRRASLLASQSPALLLLALPFISKALVLGSRSMPSFPLLIKKVLVLLSPSKKKKRPADWSQPKPPL